MRKASLGEMLAILGGLGAALAWTVTTLVASRASRLIDAWSLLATVMTVGLLVSAPVAAIAGVPSGLNRHSFGWLAVSDTEHGLERLLHPQVCRPRILPASRFEALDVFRQFGWRDRVRVSPRHRGQA